MQIDPKVALWIKIIMAVLTAITTGGLSLAGMVSPSTATQIIAYAASLLTILSIVMTAFSSSQPGPLAPPDSPAVKAATVADSVAKVSAFLLACVLGSLLLGAPRAEAATAKIPARTGIANPLDPLGLLSKISSDIQPFITFFQTWTQDDLAAAVTLSTSIPSMPDPIGQACWQTFGSIGALVQAHPLPVTLKLASDIEALRLLRSGVKAVCGKPECNQVFADLANMANAINPLAPIPTLMSFCAKIP